MSMNKFIALTAFALTTTLSFAQKVGDENEVMSKSKGEYTINTTSLCKTIGFKSTTPLLITIKKDKITKIEALPNKETPKFFDRVKSSMLPKYVGLNIKDHEKVDGVSGATRSSNAVKANVAEAYNYYKKNK